MKRRGPLGLLRLPPWMRQANCRGADPDLFFPEEKRARCDEALQLCAVCPVRQARLAFALAGPERHGVWGGTTPAERRQLLRGIRSAG